MVRLCNKSDGASYTSGPEARVESAVTIFDYVVLAVVAISLMIGVWRGMVGELLAIAAWLVAFFTARQWATSAGDLLMAADVAAGVRQAIGFLAIFIGVLVGFAMLRWAMARVLKSVGLGPLDRTLGALFGVARGLLVAWVGVFIAGLTALPTHFWWRNALLAPPFETSVLAIKPWLPAELANRIRYR